MVKFYSDRFLTNLEFTISQSDFRFAFQLPGAQEDGHTQTFSNFDDWLIDLTNCSVFCDPCEGDCSPYLDIDAYCPDASFTSPEFDSGLNGRLTRIPVHSARN